MSELDSFSDFSATLTEFIDHHSAQGAGLRASRSDRAPADFNQLALALFRLQFQNVAVYRAFCQGRNRLPETVGSWTEVPAIPVTAFREFELTSLPPSPRTTVFHSSGTTGQRPSRHFHDAESLALYRHSVWPWFLRHFLASRRGLPSDTAREGDAKLPFLFLTPPPEQVPHSSLVHMFEAVRQAYGRPRSRFIGAISADGAWGLNLLECLELLRGFAQTGQPVALLGTAFSFVHLIDGLRDRGETVALPAGSRVLETGGYKGRSRALAKSELYRSIEDCLAIPNPRIISEYGMSELSSQAYDRRVEVHSSVTAAGTCPNDARLFRFPPWARVRIVSPETGQEVVEGETGLIQVFDLANVRSVMSVQTEDLGIRQGHGFQWAGRARAAESRGCSLMTIDQS